MRSIALGKLSMVLRQVARGCEGCVGNKEVVHADSQTTRYVADCFGVPIRRIIVTLQ